MKHPSSPRLEAFEAAVAGAKAHLARGEAASAWPLLERAHVLGQRDLGRHLQVHWLMLRAGSSLADAGEVRGQLLRLVLVPLGHLFGRLPLGNTGRSNVSAFEPMPMAPELARLLDGRAR